MSTIITSPLISSKVISNLDTYIYTVNSSAPHVARLTINEIPSSGITITIQHNGSTVSSTSAPAAQQQVVELMATIPCAASDTISFIVASANASDGFPQVFKGTLNIHVGSGN